ncbi:MAG: transposase [Opitutaceae bacterium]|nr:transposase [Opitutaceae bacterium]
MSKPLPDLLRQHMISSGTFYRWRSHYGGLEQSQLHRLKKLERENTELKEIVADQTLDLRVHKDCNAKNLVEPAARRAAVDNLRAGYIIRSAPPACADCCTWP